MKAHRRSEGVYICDECIEICAEIMNEELDEYYEQDERTRAAST